MIITELAAPILSAPMAGGPSSAELAAAVTAAGGLGFLAAGYKTPDAMSAEIERVRELGCDRFGVNVFVPTTNSAERDRAELDRYRQLLQPRATAAGVELPEPNWEDTDHFDAKIELLCRMRVPLVSFTFGNPSGAVVERLHAAGAEVAVTVTDPREALAAAQVGAEAVCLQGAAAGGHRGTHRVESVPNDLDWPDLLAQVRSVIRLPIVVAGGVMTADDVRSALGAGATAVQCGTAFLLADEAGTNATYRAALQDSRFDATQVTRAFSGRPARGLRNGFIDELSDAAPAIYPLVDQATKPLRAAAARDKDVDRLALWAGTGWRNAQAGSAAEIVHRLTP